MSTAIGPTQLLPRQPRAALKHPRYASNFPGEIGGGWSQPETTAHVLLALDGKTLQVLLDLTPAEQGDFGMLVAMLQRRFGKRISMDFLSDCPTMRRGKTNRELAPEDRHKTAFTIGQGLWQFHVMPFGPLQCSCHF
ncbi:unnamed protein product [Merluccius merluccius]